jgi:hypothetical protein
VPIVGNTGVVQLDIESGGDVKLGNLFGNGIGTTYTSLDGVCVPL